MSSYRVQIVSPASARCIITVDANTREAAPAAAKAAMVSNAARWNAKYAPQFAATGIAFIAKATDTDTYETGTVRKAATKVAA